MHGSVRVSAARTHSPRLWDVGTGECTATLEGHTGAVTGLAFSPDSKTIASGSLDKTVRWV